MFKDTVRTNRNVHLSDLTKHVAFYLNFGFNASKMPLTLLQEALQPVFHIDVKTMENKLLSCSRTHLGQIETCAH